ncbi:branched-chain amino acid transaminase [bacterium]|jgi:branched-chain amino acid aminotransferase|nr:branched-chain amino acid transaminase [bacterium]
MKETKWIWKNGKLIDWNQATTHVLSHGLHYGSAVFEGVRAYETPKGPAIFKAKEHYDRLINSAKLYKFKVPFTSEELIDATKNLIIKNELKSCYIRPLVYCGYGDLGISPGKNPIETIIAAWNWGTYLGEEGLTKGVRCKMSSWKRIDSQIVPTQSKCVGNYANSILAKQEAIECGFDEAILLNLKGTVAEGPGENIFMVKDGILKTPPVSDQILNGLTRQSIIEIATSNGFIVKEESILKDELLLADELFFTGTAAEITPIREIDNYTIGNGLRGPVTKQVQDEFFSAVKGQSQKWSNWLTYCS